MTISIVVAYGENGVIGKDNKLLWTQKEDLKHFKKITEGKTVLMGKNTYLSLPSKYRPLPNRSNIVVSTNPPIEHHDQLTWVGSIDEAIQYMIQKGENEVMVIGGASIYEQMLPKADYLFATLVHTSIEGDAYFPEVEESQWVKIMEEPHEKDSENEFAYTFQLFKNNRPSPIK
jgi:dihydrofolate reductase